MQKKKEPTCYMCKRNFHKWHYLAIRFKNGKIRVDSDTKVFKRSMRSFASDLVSYGFMELEKTDWWEKGSFRLTPTKQFVEHFLSRYKDVSAKIRPDFTDEVRDKMFNSYASFLNNIT